MNTVIPNKQRMVCSSASVRNAIVALHVNRNVLVEVIVRVMYATVGLKVGEVQLVMSKVVPDGDLIVPDMAPVSPP